jgi:hypothetical protein
MNPQTVRVALELQAGNNVAVIGEDETEARTLADSLKEHVESGTVSANTFAGSDH